MAPEEESEEDSGEESAAGEEVPPKLRSVVGWVGTGEEESEGFVIVSCWWPRDALIVP